MHADSHNVNHDTLWSFINGSIVGTAPVLNFRFFRFRPFFKGVGRAYTTSNNRTDFREISFELMSSKIGIKGIEKRVSVFLRQASKSQQLGTTVSQRESFP